MCILSLCNILKAQKHTKKFNTDNTELLSNFTCFIIAASINAVLENNDNNNGDYLSIVFAISHQHLLVLTVFVPLLISPEAKEKQIKEWLKDEECNDINKHQLKTV